MEVTAKSVFDPAMLKLGSGLHMSYRHPIFVKMRYVYLLLIPLGIFLLSKGDKAFGTVFIMSGAFLFLRKYFFQYQLIKGATTSPQAGHQITTVFSKKGLHQTSDLHDVNLKWDSFCDRCVSSKALLLYPQKHMYLIFPRVGFATQEDFDWVCLMAKEKIPIKG
ncbi:MAG: hypothetical protein ACON5H_08035 [Akkermansiaceae bacterium]